MPKIEEYSNQDDWMAACVPMMQGEGKDHEAAVGACMGMWNEKKSFYGLTLEEAVKRFSQKSIQGAREALDKAIERHQRHLDGTEPADMESQKEMMAEMMQARKELDEGTENKEEAVKRFSARSAGGEIVSSIAYSGGSGSETFTVTIDGKEFKRWITEPELRSFSLDARKYEIEKEFYRLYPSPQSQVISVSDNSPWIIDSFDNYVVIYDKDKYYKVPYVLNGEKVEFAPRSEWKEAISKPEWVEVKKNIELKIGARNSQQDQERLQQIHDFAVENGAQCKPMDMMMEGKSITLEDLAGTGSAVKALGNGKIGGYLVSHSTDKDPDLTDDYFDKSTNIVVPDVLPVLYQHGFDEHIGKRILGNAKTKRDDVGLWIEAQLNMRDEYEKAIYELAEKGKLGWSSGALSHLVEREPIGKAMHIKTWFIGEASLTPTPAEPRNSVSSIKSLLTSEAAVSDKGGHAGKASSAAQTAKENLEMSDLEEFKTLLGENNKTLIATIEEKAYTAAAKAVEEKFDALPEVKTALNGRIQVTVDEGDKPFKSIAEQMRAVKSYRFVGFENADPRLKKQVLSETKALQGSNELIPSQGQFLLDPTLVADFLKPVHETGPFSSRARKMPVSSNSNYGWINGIDETARTAGNRWGGVRGYWVAEGDAPTKSQPKFRRINWELHKLAVLQYATDELLADAAQLNAVIQQSAAEELAFMCNDAMVRGTGIGQCAGILNGGALISATRTNATNIDHDDVNRMINRLLPSLYASAFWFAHPDTQPEIDALSFTSGSTGILSPYVTYTANGVTMLRGRPVIYNEYCPSLGSLGDLLLAGMDDYLMWERGGVEAASSVHVEFLTDQTVFRFTYRVDGKPASYTTLTPFQGSTTRSPYVGLAATT